MVRPTVSVNELLADLRASREGLLHAISGVSEQHFKRRPRPTESDPDPWCIAEVLAHILLDEQLWTRRMRLALDHDGTVVAPSDREATFASIRNARLAPVPQLIHGLLGSRRDLERLLDPANLEANDLQRTVVSHRGVMSVAAMARKVIDHDLEHVGQIEALKADAQVSAAARGAQQ
jgi:hypothetical protein